MINLSGASKYDVAANNAVRESVIAGSFVAVAAGNQATAASTMSPGSEPYACTVGAMAVNHSLADFSNYGPEVDVIAPGVRVSTIKPEDGTSEIWDSGTSIAAPHVAGLAAYLLGLKTLSASQASSTNLCSYIQSTAIRNIVQAPSGRVPNNYLIYNGVGA